MGRFSLHCLAGCGIIFINAKIEVMEGAAKQKSKQLAIKVVKLYRYLRDEKREYVMSKQLLRSGTGIGANLAEAECAISRKDFLAKVIFH